jgi:zinc protease
MPSRKMLLLVVVIGGLAVSPTIAQQVPPSTGTPTQTISVPYTMFTLANGLTVILHEDHSVPVVSVNVWYHAGSGREKPGRTGFAHLFEHLMFEGSAHVKEGEFDNLLEAAGASNNGSTDNDRTNYYEQLPSNALDLALYLESDRMGYLLDVVTPKLVDGQRDVVKNERRQSIENAPYGMASVRLNELLYPKDHPYHWPVVGYMEDLTAATQEDVKDFFRKYYAPGNASLVIAGDIDVAATRQRVEYWFGDVKPGEAIEPLTIPAAELKGVIKETLTDKVQLPRLYLSWLTPAIYTPGDAELDVLSGVLTGGKNARLYKRLVYDLQLAQSVSASQSSARYGSQFIITITARPSSDAPEKVLERIKSIVDEELEKLRNAPPEAREVERVKNGIEASFLNEMEVVSSKADQLNAYFSATGNPDYFGEDLGRYMALQPNDIQAALRRWLPANRRLELSVVPAAVTEK